MSLKLVCLRVLAQRFELRRALAPAALAATVSIFGGAAPALASDLCPNAAYRSGDGAKLPECRAWEQVTPVDKGGNQPYTQGGIYPAPAGDQVVSSAFGDLGGATALPLTATFSSVRSASWSTFGLDGAVDFSTDSIGLVGVTTIGFSQDRSKALIVSRHKLTPTAIEGDSNLYVRDTVAGLLTLAATSAGPDLYRALIAGGPSHFYGSDPDFRHLVFTVEVPLRSSLPQLYMASNGRIAVAGLDQDGNAPTVIPAAHPNSGQRLVSDDGRRVTFAVARDEVNSSGLYQRVDGDSTVLISHSHRADDIAAGTADDPAPTTNINSGGAWASADGTVVTFSSPALLTDDGPGPFYRWSADGDKLVSLLAGVSTPWTASASQPVIQRVSADGRYIWFTLFDRDSSTGNTSSYLYVLDTQQRRITLKASSSDVDAPVIGNSDPFNILLTNFSPDGTKLVATTVRSLSGYDQSDPGVDCVLGDESRFTNCREAYAFDAARTDRVPICISCGPAGTHSIGDANLSQSSRGDVRTTGGGNLPQINAVTDDGRVFFDTPQPLVAGDANSLSDVYEYTPGRPLELISSGTGNQPATMGATTPSGNDVFFVTADPLVAQDNDGSLDVYDARVGGGIAAQQVDSSQAQDPCPSGNCPGPQQAAPAARTPSTSSFHGRPAAPRFTVGKVSASARRSAVSTGRLKVVASVGAAGRLSARASARLRGKSTTIGRASDIARKAGRYTLTLKLTGGAQRALSRSRKLRVSLVVSYSRATESSSQSVGLVAGRSARSAKGGAR